MNETTRKIKVIEILTILEDLELNSQEAQAICCAVIKKINPSIKNYIPVNDPSLKGEAWRETN